MVTCYFIKYLTRNQMQLQEKYRPKSFDDVIGNPETILSIRQNFDKESFSKALLFVGPTGIGKTTMARIIKNHLKVHDSDFHELDTSTDRGIGFVRSLKENISYAPSMGPLKIYYLDESNFTTDAVKALKKTTEDIPDHVIFIIASNDISSLQKTKDGKALLGRFNKYNFDKISEREIRSLIRTVASKEKKKVPSGVLKMIASSSDGSARNAIVSLNSIIDFESEDDMISLLAKNDSTGSVEDTNVIEICRALLKTPKWGSISNMVKEYKGEPESARRAVLGYMKAVLLNNPHNAGQVANIIDSFSDNYFDSGMAGFVLSCYLSTKG